MIGFAEYTVKDGLVSWKNSFGELHYEGFSPARIYPDKKQEYYYNGQLYYILYPDGTKYIVNPTLFMQLGNSN